MYGFCTNYIFLNISYPKEHARYSNVMKLKLDLRFQTATSRMVSSVEVETDSVKGDSDLMVDSDDKFSDKGWHGICQFVAGWTETKKDIQKPLQTRKYLDSMEMESFSRY